MVRAEHIEKTYGDLSALKDISFEVAEGEIFGLIGPDGAGKSTLYRILTTLILPDSGRASIGGLDIIKDFRILRSQIGYMPGQFSLYSDLTVEENLEFFATVFGTTIRKNYHLIRDVYHQIEPFKKRLAGQLSGGMKQKLALSCALIHQPKVLVLDEPTTGVDAVSRREFWELLKGLKDRGITILVSTPYMDEAEMCDRVALIQGGRFLSIDTPTGITKTFGKNLYAIRGTDLYKLLNSLRRYTGAETVFPFGQVLHFTFNNNIPDRGDLQKYLAGEGNENIDITQIEPGIEDVFMKLMEKLNN